MRADGQPRRCASPALAIGQPIARLPGPNGLLRLGSGPPVTAFAEVRELVVRIVNRIGEVHDAARVVTVLQPEGMAELVDAFLERPLEKNVLVGGFAVEFGPQD